MIGDILLCEGTKKKQLPKDGIDSLTGKVALLVGANQG